MLLRLSFLIDQIQKKPVNVLILCSYDEKTKDLARRACLLVDDFYMSPVLMAEDVDIYLPRSRMSNIWVARENRRPHQGSIQVFEGNKLVQSKDFRSEKDFGQEIARITRSYRQSFLRETILKKVLILSKWANVILFLKNKELGRGGDCIELGILYARAMYRSSMILSKVHVIQRRSVKTCVLMEEIIKDGNITRLKFRKIKEYENIIVKLIDKSILSQIRGRI